MTATAEATKIYDEERGLAYQCEGYKLLCTPMVTEEILAIAFLRWSSEGLLNRIFNQYPASLKWFLDRFYGKETRVLALLKEDENKRLTSLGLGWITDFTEVGYPPVFRKAEVGTGFNRKVSPHDTAWCGRMTIDYCFDILGLDVIHGMIASPNRASSLYARKLGFDMAGPIPHSTLWMGRACSSYISTFTKEMWDNRDWR